MQRKKTHNRASQNNVSEHRPALAAVHKSETASAIATIKLNNLSHNLSVVRQAAPKAKVMAMLKANAYGHGLIEVAQHLKKSQVDSIAVARHWEAQLLREHGYTSNIVILSELISEEFLGFCAQNNIEPVIHDLAGINALVSVLAEQQVAHSLYNLSSAWLKIDTGMHRLGLNEGEYQLAIERLTPYLDTLELKLLTHFSSADETDKAPTKKQAKVFHDITQAQALEKSLANSAAILSLKETHQDWVRPGIMLYGSNPLDESQANELSLQLKPVMELSSRIIAIHQVEAQEGIGYNKTWTTPSTRRIATVSIGYGDGYPRSAENGTPVLINQQRAPLVGRVSMDMITIDISDIEGEIKLGDTVTLWGEDLSVNEVAKHCRTISYELLTGISRRVKYRYI
jgi:alanine racemase